MSDAKKYVCYYVSHNLGELECLTTIESGITIKTKVPMIYLEGLDASNMLEGEIFIWYYEENRAVLKKDLEK